VDYRLPEKMRSELLNFDRNFGPKLAEMYK
jgi:hypothetical protein